MLFVDKHLRFKNIDSGGKYERIEERKCVSDRKSPSTAFRRRPKNMRVHASFLYRRSKFLFDLLNRVRVRVEVGFVGRGVEVGVTSLGSNRREKKVFGVSTIGSHTVGCHFACIRFRKNHHFDPISASFLISVR